MLPDEDSLSPQLAIGCSLMLPGSGEIFTDKRIIGGLILVTYGIWVVILSVLLSAYVIEFVDPTLSHYFPNPTREYFVLVIGMMVAYHFVSPINVFVSTR